MSRHSSDNPLGDILALLILITLAIAVLEWIGIDLGWRGWLACTLSGGQGLLNVGVVIGIGLLFFRGTRAAGAGVLVLAIGGSYALELLTSGTGGTCGGAQPSP